MPIWVTSPRTLLLGIQQEPELGYDYLGYDYLGYDYWDATGIKE